jgi:protein transport protein SEC13
VQVFIADQHTASVNGVNFAPYELGLMLAAASSDGSVSVLSYSPDGQWGSSQVPPISLPALTWHYAYVTH